MHAAQQQQQDKMSLHLKASCVHQEQHAHGRQDRTNHGTLSSAGAHYRRPRLQTVPSLPTVCAFLSASQSTTYWLMAPGNGHDRSERTEKLQSGSTEDTAAQLVLRQRGLRDLSWGETPFSSHTADSLLLSCSQGGCFLQEGKKKESLFSHAHWCYRLT